MKENYNSDPNIEKDIKTSSTDSKENSKTTGDSQVQDGTDVTLQEEKKKAYEKSDEQQEYIDDVNVNTEIGNESPVQDGKTLSGFAGGFISEEDEEEDSDDEPLTEMPIGDNPDDSKNKTLIM